MELNCVLLLSSLGWRGGIQRDKVDFETGS